MYAEKIIKDYFRELASINPVPGGGSASALEGALGAALISKVANFTVGKEKYKSVEQEIKNILSKAEVARKELEKLCSEDARAYGKLSEAYKSPKTDLRESKIEEALKGAMEVPRNICKVTHKAAMLCEAITEKGNLNLITDVGCAAIMLESAFKSALLNVEINLKYLKDKRLVNQVYNELDPLKRELMSASKNVIKKVEESIK